MFAPLPNTNEADFPKRTRAGLAAAKAGGRRTGVTTSKREVIHELRKPGSTIMDITATLSLSKSTAIRELGRNLGLTMAK